MSELELHAEKYVLADAKLDDTVAIYTAAHVGLQTLIPKRLIFDYADTARAQQQPRRCIVQGWVQDLGLRHQAALMSAVRGCDTGRSDSASKTLTRYLRAAVINAQCGDPSKATRFVQVPSVDSFEVVDAFFKEWESLPLHYVLHLSQAAEIVGYHYPAGPSEVKHSSDWYHFWAGKLWRGFYFRVCRKLHVNIESVEELDARLNAEESDFGE